jgi:hypothetical protein
LDDKDFGIWLGRFANKLSPTQMKVAVGLHKGTLAAKRAIFSANQLREYGLDHYFAEPWESGNFFSTMQRLKMTVHVGYTRSNSPEGHDHEIRTYRWADEP